MSNQDIKCSVHSCRYNDKEKFCTLTDISIGAESASAKCKKDTECVSFEAE